MTPDDDRSDLPDRTTRRAELLARAVLTLAPFLLAFLVWLLLR